MHRPAFDLDVLRSFVMGIELGSFAKAADRAGRSASAVSAQLKKLEEQVGMPIVRKAGRGLALTPTGEMLLTHARRLLDFNDEAMTALRGANLEGWVRIGLQEDFGETLLTGILGGFARAHPRVHIEARVGRNAELLGLVRSGRLDLALAWDAGETTPYTEVLGELPLCWIGRDDGENVCRTDGEPLPLAVFEAPCLMRSAAITALDRAGIAWRHAFTSLSLSGIWAAVGAGLGVTVRTRAGLPGHLRVLDSLPGLPAVGLVLHRAEAEPPDVIRRLSEIVRDALSDMLPMRTA